MPGKHGDQRHQIRRAVRVLGRDQRERGQFERDLHVRAQRPGVDSADPRTYPDRFWIRVGGESDVFEKVHYLAGFAQDKWRFNQHPAGRDRRGRLQPDEPHELRDSDRESDVRAVPAADRVQHELCAAKAPSPFFLLHPSCILERSWVLLPGGCCRTSTGTVARS
jgi:hypothetical protein